MIQIYTNTTESVYLCVHAYLHACVYVKMRLCAFVYSSIASIIHWSFSQDKLVFSKFLLEAKPIHPNIPFVVFCRIFVDIISVKKQISQPGHFILRELHCIFRPLIIKTKGYRYTTTQLHCQWKQI